MKEAGWITVQSQRLAILNSDTQRRTKIVPGQLRLLLNSVMDDDSFKPGKLFHGYPVLGSISAIEEIFQRTAFDEILIAQNDLRGAQLDSLRSFATPPALDLRQSSRTVPDITPP